MKIVKWILLILSLFLFEVELYAQNNELSINKQITWSSLGIGINNPAEINDWTYYGIKTPYEASLWIDALKPLGGISYSGASRIWRQDGFTANEVKEWVRIGVKNPERVRHWKNSGIETAEEVTKWKNLGITEAWRCESWKKYVGSPEQAKEWMDAGFLLNDVRVEVSKGHMTPSAVHIAKEIQKKQNEKHTLKTPAYNNNTTFQETDIASTDVIKNSKSYTNIQDDFSTNHDEAQKDKNGYQAFLLIYFIVMIATMFKGYGANRTVTIFRDYNDLGLTFLIPASFVLIFYLFIIFGGDPSWGMGLALIVSISLFIILVKNTYENNNKHILPTILSLMTKMPLGIIWFLNFITMLSPGGKTAKQRRKNRGIALIIMAILTPIASLLVVEKEGSLFNPRDWIKGRRIGGIRNH